MGLFTAAWLTPGIRRTLKASLSLAVSCNTPDRTKDNPREVSSISHSLSFMSLF